MTLECLGSSSSGNCYLLHAADESLMLECGTAVREVKIALGWDIGKVVGCLVSHEHNDHAGHLKELLDMGIPVMCQSAVLEAKGLSGSVFARAIEPKRGYRVGGFKVYAFAVVHDVPCLGFLIEHAEMGKLLFVTDTMALPYRFRDLNHILIEANYSDEVLDYNIEHGITPPSMRRRLLNSHMELGTTEQVLRTLDLSEVSEVVLLHLSGNNSDSVEFQQRIREATGLPVYVAHKGMKIDISQAPY